LAFIKKKVKKDFPRVSVIGEAASRKLLAEISQFTPIKAKKGHHLLRLDFRGSDDLFHDGIYEG